MEKHIELAKKLKALADKGIDGEKINAQKMLNSLMQKHNLSIEDIDGEKTDDYFFKLKKGEDTLWSQIVKRVNVNIKCYGEFPRNKIKELGLKGNYFILLVTPKNPISIRDLSKDELKKLIRANEMAQNIKTETYRKQLGN